MSERDQLLEVSEDLQASIAALAGRVAAQPGVFALTSCARGEGVSFTVANLAIALAGCTDGDVVMVDGNSEEAVLHTAFGVAPDAGAGLRGAMNGEGDADPIQVAAGLYLLPSGRPGLGGGVSSAQFERVLAGLRGRFPHVLVDLPSLASAGMTAEWAATADRVAIVVEADRTRWQSVAVANERLAASGAIVEGVVMNKRRFPIPGWLYRRL